MPIVTRDVLTMNTGRIDWKAERDRIDLAAVVTRLLGPAPGRRVERGRRLWWRCPFHEDRNPSFCVEPGKPWWRCWGCGEHGDAATLVMKLEGKGFPEALDYLCDRQTRPRKGTAGKAPPTPPARSAPSNGRSAPPQPTKPPRGEPGRLGRMLGREQAAALAESAADRLWTPEGSAALAYLTGPERGLSHETIKAARLGVTEPVADLSGRPRGIVLPWFAGDRLALVKIRQPEGMTPKYREAYRDLDRPPELYPAPATVRPGCPLVIVEGEMDALLLGHALGDLAAVVTLGSASSRPAPDILGTMLAAAPWFIATDADAAGDKAAAEWPASARRVRPPEPFKDWTELRQRGVNLRRWWADILASCEAPPLYSWEDLASWRWGPARDDPTPGIIRPRPQESDTCHGAMYRVG